MISVEEKHKVLLPRTAGDKKIVIIFTSLYGIFLFFLLHFQVALSWSALLLLVSAKPSFEFAFKIKRVKLNDMYEISRHSTQWEIHMTFRGFKRLINEFKGTRKLTKRDFFAIYRVCIDKAQQALAILDEKYDIPEDTTFIFNTHLVSQTVLSQMTEIPGIAIKPSRFQWEHRFFLFFFCVIGYGLTEGIPNWRILREHTYYQATFPYGAIRDIKQLPAWRKYAEAK